jgi:hypothetical protein
MADVISLFSRQYGANQKTQSIVSDSNLYHVKRDAVKRSLV